MLHQAKLAPDTEADEIIAHLMEISECKDLEELVGFACTISVAPNAVGVITFQRKSALRQIGAGQLPDVLRTWYDLLYPRGR